MTSAGRGAECYALLHKRVTPALLRTAIFPPRLPPVPASVLDVERLNFRYPNGTVALCDVSFSLAPGERVGLVGPNGAGKTTLLLHLNGLLPERVPDALPNGAERTSVMVQGLPLIRRNLPAVRRQIGLLFQDPDDQLFCATVREDIAFGPLNLGLPRDEIENRIAEALQAVGMSGTELRSPHQLSLGERKRICLAGVLACRPDVLIMDEPTASLDPRSRRQFLGLMRDCPAAQLIATHDLELVLESCSRVLVLNHGRLQADGPPRQILAQTSLMEQHGLEVPLSLRLH